VPVAPSNTRATRHDKNTRDNDKMRAARISCGSRPCVLARVLYTSTIRSWATYGASAREIWPAYKNNDNLLDQNTMPTQKPTLSSLQPAPRESRSAIANSAENGFCFLKSWPSPSKRAMMAASSWLRLCADAEVDPSSTYGRSGRAGGGAPSRV
jgi:hypothetical protein